MEKLQLNVSGENRELILRQGTAPENFKVRKGIVVSGTIGVPLAHLEKMTMTETGKDELEYLQPKDNNVIDQSYLVVDRHVMEIAFVEHAGLSYESTYRGRLMLNPDFEKFCINNTAISRTPLQLAELVNMNRSFFETKSAAMKLASTLADFEAIVSKDVQAKDDGRANTKTLRQQSVKTNIPEDFKMKLPIFKGGESETFTVGIHIDPFTLECRLISPEVNDIINDVKNRLIDEQLNAIRELHSGLRIFEL